MGGFCPSYSHRWITQTSVVLGCLGLSIGFGADARAAEQLVDRMVAVVGGRPILHSDIDRKVKQGPLVSVSDFPAADGAPAFERALNDAVNLELVLDKCEELDIEISDDEVEGQIEALLREQGADRDSLTQFLQRQGMTYDAYREDFRRQMLLRRFQGRVVMPEIKLTDRDIQTYYLEQRGVQSGAIDLTLRQLLIQMPAGASEKIKEEKKNLAMEVYQKLKGGMKFEDAVRIYSDASNARTSGGLLEGLQLDDLATPIRQGLEGLEVGEFSTPIETPNGYQIFQLVKKSFAGAKEFEGLRRKLERDLRTREIGRLTRRWVEQARKRNKIEILVPVSE